MRLYFMGSVDKGCDADKDRLRNFSTSRGETPPFAANLGSSNDSCESLKRTQLFCEGPSSWCLYRGLNIGAISLVSFYSRVRVAQALLFDYWQIGRNSCTNDGKMMWYLNYERMVMLVYLGSLGISWWSAASRSTFEQAILMMTKWWDI